MKIKIIQIGKTFEEYLNTGIQEYLKRLKPYAKIEIITLKEISPSKTVTVSQCINKEGELILKNLDPSDFMIVLDEKGKQSTSVEFAKLLQTKSDLGQTITFVIGGPFGLSEHLKQTAHKTLSMSLMTYTHQMIRLFLIEQIYRAICILRGKEYHIA